MIKRFAKVVLGALVAAPLFAGAVTYPGNRDSDSYSFRLDGSGLFDVSIGATWTDLLLMKGEQTIEENASRLGWRLTGTGPDILGTLGDVTGKTFGDETITIDGLRAGHYTLRLFGSWDSIRLRGSAGTGWSEVVGDVNLLDGDLGDGKNTFHATSVSAVPEPDTYAMLLAGMGLMASVAFARRNSVRI